MMIMAREATFSVPVRLTTDVAAIRGCAISIIHKFGWSLALHASEVSERRVPLIEDALGPVADS